MIPNHKKGIRIMTLKYSIIPVYSFYDDFCKQLNSPDIITWTDDNEEYGPPVYFFWTSPHLYSCQTRSELKDRTKSLKAAFDGAMYIFTGIPSAIALRDLRFDDVNNPISKEKEPVEYDIQVSPFCQNYLQTKIQSYMDPVRNPVSGALFLSRFDNIVLDILKFTGVNGFSYVTLYSYVDFMKHCGWDEERIAHEAGWTRSQLSDFKNTANNPTYLGPFSRHGGAAPIPRRPMSLADAKGGLVKAIKALFNERANAINILEKVNQLK